MENERELKGEWEMENERESKGEWEMGIRESGQDWVNVCGLQ